MGNNQEVPRPAPNVGDIEAQNQVEANPNNNAPVAATGANSSRNNAARKNKKKVHTIKN